MDTPGRDGTEFVQGAELVQGAKLYQLVETYSDFGHHLTGSQADRSTVEWLVDQLEQLDADVEVEPFGFDQFDVSAALTITADDGSISNPVLVP